MRIKVLIFLSLFATASCRSKEHKEETKAHVTEPEPVMQEFITKLEGDFFEPNNTIHKIVFNGQTLCLYHGSDSRDEYKIYRGEVTIFKDSVNIFFRGENHPDMNLRILTDEDKNIYLQGEGINVNGRKIKYNFVGSEL